LANRAPELDEMKLSRLAPDSPTSPNLSAPVGGEGLLDTSRSKFFSVSSVVLRGLRVPLLIFVAAPALAQTAPTNDWLPRQGVELQALDKVTARRTVLDGHVGQTMQFGTLSIIVTACVVRPPDQPADAAAFVQIADSHKDEPGFRGWMLKNEPAVSMFEHPLYDIRLNGCRA
jgi:hypothetical protein